MGDDEKTDHSVPHTQGGDWATKPWEKDDDWVGSRIKALKKQVKLAEGKEGNFPEAARLSRMCWLTLCTYRPKDINLFEVDEFDGAKSLSENCKDKVGKFKT